MTSNSIWNGSLIPNVREKVFSLPQSVQAYVLDHYICPLLSKVIFVLHLICSATDPEETEVYQFLFFIN
jgi:hypothetical protein